jgi:hypothetical protein
MILNVERAPLLALTAIFHSTISQVLVTMPEPISVFSIVEVPALSQISVLPELTQAILMIVS